MKIDPRTVYALSEDVVAREIQGVIVIVPITSNIGNMEDELFTLNEYGKAIWERLDGKTPLENILQALYKEFEAPEKTIREDAMNFIAELEKRKIVVERPSES